MELSPGRARPGYRQQHQYLFVLLCRAQRGGSAAWINRAVISGPHQLSAALRLALMGPEAGSQIPRGASSQCHQKCKIC